MAKRKDKKCVRVREFLNNETNGGMAAIEYNGGYENLSISDCNRQITLEFEYYEKKHCENSIYKLDMLIHILKEFRKGVKRKIKRAERSDYEDY